MFSARASHHTPYIQHFIFVSLCIYVYGCCWTAYGLHFVLIQGKLVFYVRASKFLHIFTNTETGKRGWFVCSMICIITQTHTNTFWTKKKVIRLLYAHLHAVSLLHIRCTEAVAGAAVAAYLFEHKIARVLPINHHPPLMCFTQIHERKFKISISP